ncbi:HNH endonuclease [Chloroflexota bacterium]
MVPLFLGGGKTTLENNQVLCKKCNQMKGVKPRHETGLV